VFLQLRRDLSSFLKEENDLEVEWRDCGISESYHLPFFFNYYWLKGLRQADDLCLRSHRNQIRRSLG